MDNLEINPSDGSPPLVMDTPDEEPGSKALIGEGLKAKLKKFWFNGGGSKVIGLSRFPRY